MNKKIIAVIYILFILVQIGHAQEKIKIYNPNADAQKELSETLAKAKTENKHVLLQVGGNWCSWCVMLHKFMHTNAQIDSVMNANYVFLTINYSKENKNPEILKQLEYPHRFGFPVLVVLNAEGRRLHTQNTVYLEENKGYNAKRILDFLNAWSPEALKPENYQF